MLVNGRRISGFREIRSFPPEVIERVEVYPEEVALQFGYRADQRVVNFVLKSRFRAAPLRVAAGESIDRGGESFDLGAGYLNIDRDVRFNLNAEFAQQLPLHDSDRSIAATPDIPDDVDDSRFRTLIAGRDEYAVGGSYAFPLSERIRGKA